MLNMREWASSYETMDQTDKSKHSAKWIWDLNMHGIIPEEWPTEAGDEDTLILQKTDWVHSAITGTILEAYQGYQKGQFDRRDRVKKLGRKTELGSAMNRLRGSVHPLSIKHSEDRFASLRLQEYLGLFVYFVCRHHQVHTDKWNKYMNAKYATSDQVQDFLDVADQLVFIMEILRKTQRQSRGGGSGK
jgi:hypothetical protein